MPLLQYTHMPTVMAPSDREAIGKRIVEAGMPRRHANALAADLLRISDPKAPFEFTDEVALFFLRRGLVLTPNSSHLMGDYLKWHRKGGSVEELEALEEKINDAVSWRPGRPQVNLALQKFFEAAKAEFDRGSHEGLKSFQNPHTPLGRHLKNRNVRFASNTDLVKFLDQIQKGGERQEIPPFPDDVAAEMRDIVRGLPNVVTEQDVDRYAMILGNPAGELDFATGFPVKFGILPTVCPAQGPEASTHAIVMVPESWEVGGRLQRTEYKQRSKKNHYPGALAFCELRIYPKAGIGVQIEVQSDHDPKETRGLGIHNWPDIMRAVMHIDFESRGIKTSLVPKCSKTMGQTCLEDPDEDHGRRKKFQRAYGTDEEPPKGYAPIIDNAALEEGIIDSTKNYWIRRIGQSGV